ncbi:MAG: hypothetical protein CBC48_11455 [bacterium TMED88]|nr:hypothetical protein [Deltaproteobacteria bacterium]OUV29850.1 MAG: hypothetical protein CBC48_11455 [bacterium TMED88]
MSSEATPREPRGLQSAGSNCEWLVDAYNVIHVTLLGGTDRSRWWTAPVRAQLIERAGRLPPGAGQIWLVFDGSDPIQPEDAQPGGLKQIFAPSADEWIVRRLKTSPDVEQIVVTADRRLAGRCRHHGARILSPGEFVRACGETEADSPDSEKS